jgi:hypothetical protein
MLCLHPSYPLPPGYRYGDMWSDDKQGISGRFVIRESDGVQVRSEFDLFGPDDEMDFDTRFSIAAGEDGGYPE